MLAAKTVLYAFCALFLLLDAVRSDSVLIHNNGRHHAHMKCASKNDKIGGNDGVWIEPHKSLSWRFGPGFFGGTIFWCDMDWYGRSYHWDVYRQGWWIPDPVWTIKDDGVYDIGMVKRVNLYSG